jgi:translation initiation factor 3 subunit M
MGHRRYVQSISFFPIPSSSTAMFPSPNDIHPCLPDPDTGRKSVIRAGLLSGKLSQTSQSLHITRSTARTFEREQWEALERRLVAWKAGLAGVLEVVAAARKQGAPYTAGQAQVAA